MKNKLIVAGCSVSDYNPQNKITYGEVLSSYLDYDYVHLSAGCGSNFRIWRLLTTMIRNNEISENDIVIIQYTSVERKEFFTSYGTDEYPQDKKRMVLKEVYDDGATIKFKIDSYKFYRNVHEVSFLKRLEDEFISVEYDNEVFLNNQLAFQCLLKEKNIKTIFIRQSYYQPREIPIINYERQIYVPIEQFFVKGLSVEEDTPFYGHLNDEGHKKVGEHLFEIIKEKKFIE